MRQTPQRQDAYSSDKAVRLEARLSCTQKELIQHAADLQGRSLTDFVISTSQEAARKVIREHEIVTLTAKESQSLVRALLSPSEPNAALQKAAKRHKNFNTKNH